MEFEAYATLFQPDDPIQYMIDHPFCSVKFVDVKVPRILSFCEQTTSKLFRSFEYGILFSVYQHIYLEYLLFLFGQRTFIRRLIRIYPANQFFVPKT
ncbi:unnamed protein product [Schistosoma mattheei]|uniref:Uncharacterized protein n=1 Tax=Schistosoma mattheei TaxID=31246 RepID=A0AA85B579_9TREM|nr:unnamed protein product [Schistosoma mattheei]